MLTTSTHTLLQKHMAWINYKYYALLCNGSDSMGSSCSQWFRVKLAMRYAEHAVQGSSHTHAWHVTEMHISKCTVASTYRCCPLNQRVEISKSLLDHLRMIYVQDHEKRCGPCWKNLSCTDYWLVGCSMYRAWHPLLCRCWWHTCCC